MLVFKQLRQESLMLNDYNTIPVSGFKSTNAEKYRWRCNLFESTFILQADEVFLFSLSNGNGKSQLADPYAGVTAHRYICIHFNKNDKHFIMTASYFLSKDFLIFAVQQH